MYQVLLIVISMVIFTGCAFKHSSMHKDSRFKTTTEAYNCETEDAIYKLTYSYESTMTEEQVDKEREKKLKQYGSVHYLFEDENSQQYMLEIRYWSN